MEDAYPAEGLKKRSKQFAIRVIRLFQALPKTDVARILGRQLLRSATGAAANYRAVCRARSKAEFIAKIGVVVEEADETVFWLELLVEAGIVAQRRMEKLHQEATELLAIFAASQHTARTGNRATGSMKQ
ncbi:MAG: four helix bundle protein [Terriglobia bacterium]|jgi:four helix bundle protein